MEFSLVSAVSPASAAKNSLRRAAVDIVSGAKPKLSKSDFVPPAFKIEIGSKPPPLLTRGYFKPKTK